MKLRFAIGVLVALAMPAAGVSAGSCGAARTARCAAKPPSVNFLAVPDITKEIILSEPTPPPSAVKTIAPQPAAPAPQEPYSGPFIGANRNERAPTIGFYWSTN
jgi:hypothetical protein